MKAEAPNNLRHFDEQQMRRAMQLARRGAGHVEPNPMVGCVLVRRGEVVGEGFHRRFGGPHAEIAAIRSCKTSLRGATVYVTLEPCCHHGKTPPCVDALIAAGVSRVVVGSSDPNPCVSGRGVRKLRRAGVIVELGLLKREAQVLIAPFATVHALDRPFVIAKWAEGRDGQLVTPVGASPWISCDVSQRFVHRLRARVDAILVGSETVRADDPLLTARGVAVRRVATRVVLDGRLRISMRSKLVETAGQAPVVVFTAASRVASRKARTLASKGVEVVAVRERKRGLCLADVMRNLGKRGVTNLLVEGGPTILDAFFNKKLVDEAFVFVAPQAVGRLDRAGVSRDAGRISANVKPLRVEVARSGVDLRYHWRLTRFPSRRG